MTQRQQVVEGRFALLWQRAQVLYRQGGDVAGRDEVLAHAFDELELALEALQAAEAQLQRADERLADQRLALEQSAEYYRQLFNWAPAAYVITSLDGTIRLANAAAATLLGVEARSMLGRALMLYMPIGQRRSFRTVIAQTNHSQCVQVFAHQLRAAGGELIDVQMRVLVERGRAGRPQSLWWLVIPRAEPATPGLATLIAEEAPASCAPAPAVTDGQLAALADASVLLATAADATALPQLARLLVPALADGCLLDLDSPDGAAHQLTVAFDGAVMAAGGPDHISTASALRQLLQSHPPGATIVAPVRWDSHEFGTLTLMYTSAERGYGANELALAQALADRLGAALARLRGLA